MTITIKDPNGVEWRLLAWSLDDESRRDATVADLLSALGQLSPGSDGPTDNELDSIWWDHTHAACDSRAGNRALYNAGLALGEQKQAARVRELEAEVRRLNDRVTALRKFAKCSRCDGNGALYFSEKSGAETSRPLRPDGLSGIRKERCPRCKGSGDCICPKCRGNGIIQEFSIREAMSWNVKCKACRGSGRNG